MNRRFAAFALYVLSAASFCAAQKLNPVQWTLAVEPAQAPPGSRVAGRLTAKLESGWHLYALAAPNPIIPTTIHLADSPAVASFKLYHPAPHTAMDENFGVEVASYEGEVVFLLDIQLAKTAPAGPVELTAETRFQSCNNKMCMPPKRASATATLTVAAGAKVKRPVIPAGYTLFGAPEKPAAAAEAPKPTLEPAKPQEAAAVTPSPVSEPTAAPTPVAQQSTAPTPSSAPAPAVPAQPQGLPAFLLVAFGFGLAAIFTPCVFPMIPITMSYFLNRPEGKRATGVRDAVFFCLGIVVLFSGMGLLTTAVLGPFGVVQLGSNVWVNTFISAVFLAFGLSLLGAFEITLPSSLLTRLNNMSEGGGIAGTLLMGLTFSLTAFACVGPFVGTLLAASVSGGGLQPLFGMVAFSSGLATPFFFLALFPSYLKRMPRSGGWLDRVKVVMGLLVLAAMCKYLSAVDQVMQWNLLTRERFLAAWIVLFALAGLYLLGLLRLRGIKPEETVGTTRLLIGAAFLVFAISLIPGMLGGRLGELDAYVPPPSAQSGPSGAASSAELPWMKNQLREALARARQENKRVFVSFSGYACTNCHWMKANMFPRPEITAALKDFVLVELYTDGSDAESERNQKLQESKFSTVAIPYYAILDADEKVVASYPGLTRKPEEFLAFLRSGSRS